MSKFRSIKIFLGHKYKYLLLILLFLSLWSIATNGHLSMVNREARYGMGYYGKLAEAFSKGQLSLLVHPPTELVQLDDPYDISQNIEYILIDGVNDASLYNGKLYLYWGPFPAIVRILSAQQFDQNFMTMLYIFMASFFFYKIAARIRDKYFINVSDLLLYAVCAAGIFNGISIYMLTVIGIYYEAIAAAMAFSSAGLYFFLKSITTKNVFLPLFLCGLFFSFAISSRIHSIFVLLPVVIFFIVRFAYKKNYISEITKLSFFALPLFVTACLLLLYNYLRFDNLFEFGLSYQLVGSAAVRQNIVEGTMMDFQNLWRNLYQYLLAMPHFIPETPFLTIDPVSNVERIVWSAFIISPLSLFLLGNFFILKKLPNELKYFLLVVAASAFLTLFFLSLMPNVTPRFITDFLYLFNIVGVSFLFYLFSQFHSKRIRRVQEIFMVALVLFTLAINFPLFLHGISEYQNEHYVGYQHFFNLINQ